jgi:ATP-binding cassette subfamily B protein
MPPPESIRHKIKNALRIDRAFLLVWKAGRKWTLLSICLTVIQGVIPLLTLYIMKLIVDTIAYAVQSGDTSGSLERVIYLIIAATVIAIVQAGIRLLGNYVSEAQGAVVTDFVSSKLHEKSIALDLAFYENPKYHDTLHRAQREGPYRPTKIVNGLTRMLQNAVSLVAMVGLLFIFHWGVGVLLFVATIPGMFVQVIYARKRFVWQKKRTQEERRASYLSNVLTADLFAKEIRLFDLGSFFSNSFDTIRNLLRGEKLALSRKKNVAEFFAQVFAAAVLMGCLMLITIRALNGAITVGDMVMFYQAFQRGIGHLKEMLSNIAALYEDNMFVAHFFEFLDIQNQIQDPTAPVRVPSKFKKGISFDQVSFRYPGERSAVLEDITLTIGAGEVVALVGANGAGKSTLVKLLCRLYDPEKGTITMEGLDLHRFSLKDLRKQISVVFQDYAKYFLTVKENIRLGDISIPEDSGKIREAAEKANADVFIQKLPRGYDTILGRWFFSGEELSIGEWQILVLGREFLRDSQLIILDEPTSSLDIHTEYHLYMKFRELIAGHSALLISHRFSTVRMADRIYVLDNGRISEAGTHKELMALDGTYADMYNKQAAWLTENDEKEENEVHCV